MGYELFRRNCMIAPLLAALLFAAPAPHLTPADRDRIISASLADLRARYIDPEKAAEVARAIDRRRREHAYDGATTGEALADALTADLRRLAGDRHLGLIYSARPLEPTPLGKTLPKLEGARLERMRQRAQRSNFGIRKVERLPGNVGLLSLASFPAPEIGGEAATAAMRLLNHTDALIVDLRGNGGGFSEQVALFLGWLLPRSVHIHDLVWSQWGKVEIHTPESVPQGRWKGKEIYVLVDRETISAGEQMAWDLRARRHATVIGETTAGAANPTVGLVIDPHFANAVPMGRAEDPLTHSSWEGVGVKPDRAVAPEKALEVAQRLALDALASRIKDPAALAEIDEARQELR